MATAVIKQHDDFQAAFAKELDAYLQKLQKPRYGEKKDPERLRQLKSMAESMADNIGRCMSAYAHDLRLDTMPAKPSDHVANAPCSRLEGLEAELRRRSAEEDHLRSELAERQKAIDEEALRQRNADIQHARQEALACDQVPDADVPAMKGEQLQQQLNQIAMVLSATDSLASTVAKDRENNRRIEEQLRRPPHYMEDELLAPLGYDTRGDAGAGMEDAEAQRLSAELERSQKVCKRMQRQFDDFA